MKKLFLISAVTAGLFTSCVQNDLIAPELSEAEKEIKFQTVVEKHRTRAIITGTGYDSNAPSFGTYIFQNPNGDLPGTIPYNKDGIEEIIHHNHTTHYWAPKDGINYMWPPAGSLTFFSYSPYKFQETMDAQGNPIAETDRAEISPTIPVIGQSGFIFNEYNVAAHQETDLMVADVRVGEKANVKYGTPEHTGVPTLFRHKLALIGGFILLTSEDYDGSWEALPAPGTGAKAGDMRFLIKRIELLNVPVVGTFKSEGRYSTGTVIPEQWSIVTNPTTDGVEPTKTYVWFDSSQGVEFGHRNLKQLHIYSPESPVENTSYAAPNIDNGYLLMIPQTFEQNNPASLRITYVIESWNTEQNKWVPTTRIENGVTKADIERTLPLSTIHSKVEDDKTVTYGGWEMGKKIIYTLEFSTEEIRWAPAVVEWSKQDVLVDF